VDERRQVKSLKREEGAKGGFSAIEKKRERANATEADRK
jgi:hypothetical protein